MAYLGMCTMDLVEYVNPLTGETTYASSSCPPKGFVRVETGAEQYDLIEERVQPGLYKPTPMTLPAPLPSPGTIQLTPQQIEAQVKQIQPAPTGGGLALAAIAALLLLG